MPENANGQGVKMVIVYKCQFCGEESPKKEWKEEGQVCPKCGKKYDYQLAQDSEE
jgi:DNA-directed RNA polymerase subunit RPC12/RpoP